LSEEVVGMMKVSGLVWSSQFEEVFKLEEGSNGAEIEKQGVHFKLGELDLPTV
jgi:hypothetical protein